MRKLPIALMVLGHTVVDASQNILPVLLPLLQKRFDLSYTQIGLAVALLTISSSMIQPVFGWVSDRWNTQWFIPAGIVWTGLFMGLAGLAPSYLALATVLTLTGLGTAAFHPVASMAAAYASGAQRGLGMSFFSAGGNLGFALGPILMTWFLGWFNLRGTLLLVVMALAAAALIHVYRSEIEVPVQGGRRRQTADGGQVPRALLAALCGLIALRSWGSSGLVIFIPLYLVQQGMALPLTGRALFVFLFFGAFGGMLGGHLSDRIGRQRVIAGSLLIFPGLMAAALLVTGGARWFLLAMAGMALLASFSVTVVFAQELLPRHVGLASGLTFGLSFGMGGLGVWISGVVADLLGLATSVWILVLLPGIGGMVALCLRPRRGMPAGRQEGRSPRLTV